MDEKDRYCKERVHALERRVEFLEKENGRFKKGLRLIVELNENSQGERIARTFKEANKCLTIIRRTAKRSLEKIQ